ncbi:radial spoke head protein 9 [Paraphysoderma sedebokerense]|nr:radial spoke head protein 9 [Paraphysoderma sedebokerense]
MAQLADLPYFSTAGFTFNVEERSSLSSSLITLKHSQNFDRVFLWGKVLGIQHDYLIAGCESPNKTTKWMYSLDAFNWVQLPEVTTEQVKQVSELKPRFLGDPAFEYQIAVGTEDDKAVITEETRLRAVIQLINEDVSIVPRGAYYKDATNTVQINRSFQGLSDAEVDQLSSYFHFRPNLTLEQLSKVGLNKPNFEESIDIFESIENDHPKGIWSLQKHYANSTVTLKSLLWPGYVAFHAPQASSSKFGAMYYGTGQKNLDVGFML